MVANVLDDKLIQQSVRDVEPPDSVGIPSDMGTWGMWGGAWSAYTSQASILPQWGTRIRDLKLRQYYTALYNTLVQSAIAQLIKRVKQTPYELSGGARMTRYFQELFAQAGLDGSFSQFLSKFLLDYFTQDFGAVFEIIGKGDPDKPLVGQAMGMNQLDSLRCVASGNPEFPILYRSHKTGKFHRMHYTRVQRMVDMPTANQSMYDYGLCAMSRIIGVTSVQMRMMQYQDERLANLPPTGIMTVKGILEKQYDAQAALWRAQSEADGENVFRGIFRLHSPDPNIAPEVTFTPFSQLPDSFNYKEYMEVHVNLVALALGDDPQNIWPLTGQNLGTGTQSVVLHSKGQAKTFGDILTDLERVFNFAVLPVQEEFKWKYKDSQQDKEIADTAAQWATIASTLVQQGIIDVKTANELLANNVETYADVLLDEQGNVRLPSDDPKPDNEVTATDAASLVPEGTPAPTTTAPNDIPVIPPETQAKEKDIGDVENGFTADFADMLKAAAGDEATRRRSGTVARAIVAKYIKEAYKEGLIAGGVEDDLSSDDLDTIAGIVVEQSSYVTDMLDTVHGSGADEDSADSRAVSWFNKSIMPAFNAGLMTADADGMYEFTGDDGEESCVDCQRLKGQRHRLHEWDDSNVNPIGDSSGLACGGFKCQHTLEKVKGRSRGSW